MSIFRQTDKLAFAKSFYCRRDKKQNTLNTNSILKRLSKQKTTDLCRASSEASAAQWELSKSTHPVGILGHKQDHQWPAEPGGGQAPSLNGFIVSNATTPHKEQMASISDILHHF